MIVLHRDKGFTIALFAAEVVYRLILDRPLRGRKFRQSEIWARCSELDLVLHERLAARTEGQVGLYGRNTPGLIVVVRPSRNGIFTIACAME